MSRRMSFSEKRRRRLTVKPEVLLLETKNTITEPISVMGLASGAFGGLARLGLIQVHGGQGAAATVRPQAAPGASGRAAMARGHGTAVAGRHPAVRRRSPGPAGGWRRGRRLDRIHRRESAAREGPR